MPPFVGSLLGVLSAAGKNDDRPQSISTHDTAGAVDAACASVGAKARQLGVDVVECTHSKNLYTLSIPLIDVILHDDASIVMRKIVKKIIREKQPAFRGMIQSLRPADYADFRAILSDVIRNLVTGSSSHDAPPVLSWGKIVTAYAFGGLFANDAIAMAAASSGSASYSSYSVSSSASSPPGQMDPKELGMIVGEVVDQVAGPWIQQQGGWKSFAHFFSTINAEESLTRNLVYLVCASAAASVGLVWWKAMVK